MFLLALDSPSASTVSEVLSMEMDSRCNLVTEHGCFLMPSIQVTMEPGIVRGGTVGSYGACNSGFL
ncbi:MAG: hypothetical protein ABFC80_00670, partial [Coriobacteriales bacterium]